MKLQTVVRDCLFLNWALPAAALPEPPAGLRWQRHEWHGGDYVFASALLFHHDAVRWSAFPLLRIGYPQLNLRLHVLDGEGVPGVLFLRELMPAWVAPGVRLLSRHPASSARLDFPRPSRHVEAKSWLWRAQQGASLTVRAWMHSPAIGAGPRLGGWDETVRYFLERPRGYAEHEGALHRVDASHPPADAVWPLAAEIEGGAALLRHLLPLGALWPSSADNGHGAPALHSSWLCPEMPFSIVFDRLPKVQPVVNGLPHPAAGRVSTPALRRTAQPDVEPMPAAGGAAMAGEMTAAAGVLASAA